MSEQSFKKGDRVSVDESVYHNVPGKGTVVGKSTGRGDWSVLLDGYGYPLNFFDREMEIITKPRKSSNRSHYSPELKARVLADWRENLKRDKRKSKATIARKHGVNVNTFRMWVAEKQSDSDGLDSLKVGDTVMSSSGPKRVLELLPQHHFALSMVNDSKLVDGRNFDRGWSVKRMRELGFVYTPNYQWNDDADETSTSEPKPAVTIKINEQYYIVRDGDELTLPGYELLTVDDDKEPDNSSPEPDDVTDRTVLLQQIRDELKSLNTFLREENE